MEINTQHLEALFQVQEQQAQPQRKLGGQSTGFEALLNSQLNAQAEVPAVMDNLAAQEATAAMISQVLPVDPEESAQLDPDEAAIQAAFDQASGTLDLWDKYASTLGSSAADNALREAWTLLQGIDSQLSQIRANPVTGSNAGLNSLLNDLEVMTATEKFKFNRGDYLV